MPLVRKITVIKVAMETVKGTKVAGTLVATVTEAKIKDTSGYEKRPGSGKYLGNTLGGTRGPTTGDCSFTAELLCTGLTALEPTIAALIQACAFKKTSEVYNSNSVYSDAKTLSVDMWIDGKKKGLAGASGTVTLEGEAGKVANLKFEFKGIWQSPTDEAVPAVVLPTANTMKMSAFTLGGDSVGIAKYSLAMNNEVAYRTDGVVAGATEAMVTDFDPELGVDPEEGLVATHDFDGIMIAGTEEAVSMAFTDGTDTLTIALPKVVTKELDESDREGLAVYDYKGQCNHDSGDDAVTMTMT